MDRRLRWTAAWVVTRLLAAGLLAASGVDAMSDVGWHYRGALERLGSVGLGGTLPEYPLPAVPVIAVPWLATGALGAAGWYLWAFALCMVAVDAVMQWLLLRGGGHRAGALVWLIGVPLQGAFIYFRFDLVPAVLLATAVLSLSTRPGRAMTLLVLATAGKLWPVLAFPALLAGSHSRRRSLIAAAGGGGVVLAGCLLLADWSRLVSPLAFQGRRGIEVESVWALPSLISAVWGGQSSWSAYTMTSFSFEIDVPPLVSRAASLSQLVLLLALLILWWRLWRQSGPAAPATVVWVVLTSVTGFIVTNTVLSPQYLVWLLAPAAAGLAMTRADQQGLRSWTVGLLICTALTQLVYPTLFADLTARGRFSEAAVGALLLRNLGLLLLLAWAWRRAWQCTARAGSRAGISP